MTKQIQSGLLEKEAATCWQEFESLLFWGNGVDTHEEFWQVYYKLLRKARQERMQNSQLGQEVIQQQPIAQSAPPSVATPNYTKTSSHNITQPITSKSLQNTTSQNTTNKANKQTQKYYDYTFEVPDDEKVGSVVNGGAILATVVSGALGGLVAYNRAKKKKRLNAIYRITSHEVEQINSKGKLKKKILRTEVASVVFKTKGAVVTSNNGSQITIPVQVNNFALVETLLEKYV
jgi:hypothetical protein